MLVSALVPHRSSLNVDRSCLCVTLYCGALHADWSSSSLSLLTGGIKVPSASPLSSNPIAVTSSVSLESYSCSPSLRGPATVTCGLSDKLASSLVCVPSPPVPLQTVLHKQPAIF